MASAVVGLGAVASFLSTTVVNVAIPTLQRDLHATLTAVQWTSSGYLLGLAAVVPISGWMADRFGARRTYLSSLVLFAMASLLCGFARDIETLIALRVLQGMSGGFVMPVGMAFLMRIFPPQQRGKMMAALGIPNMLAPALGPTLSGWLLVHSSWQYIFWINIPFCAVTLVAASIWLRDHKSGPASPLDVVGAALGMPSVAVLMYGMTQASQTRSGLAPALVPIAVGLSLMAAFVIWELRQTQPLIDLRIFRDAAFGASSVTSVLITTGVFSLMLLVPVFLQQVQGYSAFDAGSVLAVQALATAMMLPFSGWATDRFGARPIVMIGCSAMAIASFLIATAGPHTTRTTWFVLLAIRGCAGAWSMMPVTSAAFVTIAPALMSRAIAVFNTIQRIGMAFGAAMVATVADSRTSAALSQAGRPGAAALRHATEFGLSEAMLFAAGTSLLAIPTVILLRRPLPPGRESEGHPPVPRSLKRIAVALAVLAICGSGATIATSLLAEA